ncbi:polysaccharide biosynthesis protein [Radiobacillus kanasensis]|uniref:UDP-N-acetylglucosamine 4,6-dehydratase family protein n=1 Tax=Radiobacillus kanasensis TaxID=2844358 RepID=UPI001E43696C|nr:UDP-N-acetylglucosamine 4,6-dehydratase family protein [Radiobacillus kanasensis]UFT98889.1 polysaccharide biosynthesis protein [Radiobacillus kanasensis]
MFKDKTILVTGGTGSIGSEIVRQLLNHNPKVIRIFSRDESKHFEFQQELSEYKNVRFLVGDIRDKERINYATKDVDIIFHAAALKHVPSSEYNPFEAVKTNVIGVQNVIEAAINNNVEKVVAISTDKVVNPTNTMGATKLLSERLISAAEHYKGNAKTVFSCVRFGNVMGSRGSVIPLFKRQIEEGRDVTLTDKRMTRFMMSIPQASKLVLKAAELSSGGEIYVLKMPVLYITELAETLLEDFNNKRKSKSSSSIVETGIRPGEKIYEELMTIEESERAYDNDKMYAIFSHLSDNTQHSIPKGFKKAERNAYSSKDEKPLTKQEIFKLLENSGLLFN